MGFGDDLVVAGESGCVYINIDIIYSTKKESLKKKPKTYRIEGKGERKKNVMRTVESGSKIFNISQQ